MITQTLKTVFNIQSTLGHLAVDKSYSNLIYIPIAERIPLTNHAQIIILTKRRLKCSDNFLRFVCIVFTWNGQVFIPIALYPHEIKLLQSWLIFRLDTCVHARTHTDTKSASHPCLSLWKRWCVSVVTYADNKEQTQQTFKCMCVLKEINISSFITLTSSFFIDFTYVWLSVFVLTLCMRAVLLHKCTSIIKLCVVWSSSPLICKPNTV